MNRNVKMDSNYSNGRGYKTNGTGLSSGYGTGMNSYGQDKLYGGRTNTNSKVGAVGGFTNIGNTLYDKKPKFSEDEMNEAKEALKSLKMKIGGNTTSQRSTNINGNRTNVGSNDNYRKAFKPSLDNDYGVSNTYSGYNNGSSITSNKPKVTMTTKPKVNPYANNRLQPVEDDRPAIAQGKNNFNIDAFASDEGDIDNGDRIECQGCGRKFAPESYEKHSKVCKKVFQTKRKAFDTKKQRILDSEHAAILRQKEFEEKKKGKVGLSTNTKNVPSKKSKWKKQSEEFRAIMRANTQGVKGNSGGSYVTTKGGGSAYQSTPSVLTEDYIPCNYCNRKYNEQAYNKHLPGCERRSKEAMMKNKMKPGVSSNSTFGVNKPNLNVRFNKK